MKVVGRQILDDFKSSYPDTAGWIDMWLQQVDAAHWQTPHELKRDHPKARILKNRFVIFEIRHNRYRMLVRFSYVNQVASVQKIDAHQEYDKWNLD